MNKTVFMLFLTLFCISSLSLYAQEVTGEGETTAPATATEAIAPATATEAIAPATATGTTAAEATKGELAPVSEAGAAALQSAEADLALGESERIARENAEREKKESEAQSKGANDQDMPNIPVWELIKKGGVIMWPIALLSVIGLMFALERFVALRNNAILPRKLFHEIEGSLNPSSFSAQYIWGVCERFPSPSSRVIQSMLLKAGRPISEVEKAVEEAKQVEATSMYNNVRWLTLVAALSPLLGLLGTVFGMIQAFFVTANMPTGGSRAELLAEGIYTALVTTAAGLVVAIPAALLAHWFEGKILNAFRKLDQKLVPLMEQMERMENGPRFTLSDYKSGKK